LACASRSWIARCMNTSRSCLDGDHFDSANGESAAAALRRLDSSSACLNGSSSGRPVLVGCCGGNVFLCAFKTCLKGSGCGESVAVVVVTDGGTGLAASPAPACNDEAARSFSALELPLPEVFSRTKRTGSSGTPSKIQIATTDAVNSRTPRNASSFRVRGNCGNGPVVCGFGISIR
jgi:hypothetical protein